MEQRDLFDEKRNLSNKKIFKGDVTPKGLYHLTVLVFIENSKEEILLQKRTHAKGGQWALTGGHPKSGESSLQGIQTEIQEELGIYVEKEDLKLFKSYRTENSFRDLYHLKKDIDVEKMKIQKKELEMIGWFSKEKIEEMISKKEAFGDFAYEFDFFLDFKKRR